MGPQLLRLIKTRFKDEQTLPQALALVNEGGGITRCGWGCRREGSFVQVGLPMLSLGALRLAGQRELLRLGRAYGWGKGLPFPGSSRHAAWHAVWQDTAGMPWRGSTTSQVGVHIMESAATHSGHGMHVGACRARALAREEGETARAALSCLPDTPSKRSLELMVDYVLERLY